MKDANLSNRINIYCSAVIHRAELCRYHMHILNFKTEYWLRIEDYKICTFCELYATRIQNIFQDHIFTPITKEHQEISWVTSKDRKQTLTQMDKNININCSVLNKKYYFEWASENFWKINGDLNNNN